MLLEIILLYQKKQCTLILCGSSIRMMEAQVLSVKSPLYGRRTGQWKIESFPFHLFHHIFPNHSFEARLQFFSILDGIPAYIKKMNNKKSVPWNLKHKIFKKGEYLYEEAENLLRQELRTPRNYNAILQAIAEGYNKFGGISNRTEFSKSLLSQYLKNLQKLHVIKKNFPITQQKEKRLIYLIRMISTSFSKISPEILLKERIELLVLVILAKIVDGKGTYHIFNLISVKSKN